MDHSTMWPCAVLMLEMLATVVSAGEERSRWAPWRRVVRRGDGPLHRVDTTLASQGRAPQPRLVGGLHSPTETQVVRIVLTGGPCAGKSSMLAHLTDAAKREGFDVYAAPETATLMFNCGFSFPRPDDPQVEAKVLAFQCALFKLQLQLERSMTLTAASTGRPSIIVFDRGLMDAKGYMSPAGWAQLLHSVAHEGRDVVLLGSDITEDYIRQRYDGVVHLVTAADGAAEFYRYGEVSDDAGHRVYRTETPEEAIDLDQRMQKCWSAHPRHVVVGNEAGGGFAAKLSTATEIVLSIARLVHPDQAVRI